MSQTPFWAEALTADFKTTPYRHQMRELEESIELPSRALLWQMRTGKTKVVIDTACHLYREGKIDAVVIFAPNGVHENWMRRELPIHHWDLQYESIYWRTSVAAPTERDIGTGITPRQQFFIRRKEVWWRKFEKLLVDRDQLPWFTFPSAVMTRDDCKRAYARIWRRRKRVMVIFDESHDYRSPGSSRTKTARSLAKKSAYRRILTGTIVDNSPLHAYTQFELLEPGALGYETFADFKAEHAVYEMIKRKDGREFPKLVSYRGLEVLRARMAEYSSVILREDCDDMPDIVRTRRPIILTEEQHRIYSELQDNFVIQVDDQTIDIGEQAQKLIKLQQIVSGFIKDEFGEVTKLQENPRLDELLDEVQLTTGKVIIWCQFQHDIDVVTKALRKAMYEVVEYHGRTTDDEKAFARQCFAPGAENDIKALVGQAMAGGSGLDLSAANKIIWYSHTFDAIVRGQADERATKVGGKNIAVVDLVAPGVDEYILDKVGDKVSVADDVAKRGLKKILEEVAL